MRNESSRRGAGLSVIAAFSLAVTAAEAQQGCDVPMGGFSVVDKISFHLGEGADKTIVDGAVGNWRNRCGALIPTLGVGQHTGFQRWVVKLDPELDGCGRTRKLLWIFRSITLNPNCDLSTTLKHEIGHVLGMGDISILYNPECRGNIMESPIRPGNSVTGESCLGVREAWKGIDSETTDTDNPGGGDTNPGGSNNPGGGANPDGNPWIYVDCDEEPDDPRCGSSDVGECLGEFVLREGGDPNNVDDWECQGQEL